ncbi:hypothetical protein, partial [Pantoea graminicola]|uniref:hypothetical protein n=1 Tax=Pantoea sp. ARC607 TaxID=2027922 RepID=UPI001F435C5D
IIDWGQFYHFLRSRELIRAALHPQRSGSYWLAPKPAAAGFPGTRSASLSRKLSAFVICSTVLPREIWAKQRGGPVIADFATLTS